MSTAGCYTAEGFLPVLTAEGMQAADRWTIETFGVPGFTLMESAGRAAVDAMERRYDALTGKRVAVFCGKGNNGGDGLVVARVLHARGVRVHVVLTAEKGLTQNTAQNLQLLRTLRDESDDGSVEIATYSPERLASLRADIYVDALLGIGLTSDLREPILNMVNWLNRQPEPTVAIDVPTGLNCDTGEMLGAAIRADLTVTMGALKTGLLLGDGPTVSGSVEVAEIGIPAFLIERALQGYGGARLTSDAAIRRWLPHRSHGAHKYSVGMALVVGGSHGLTGAPTMSSTAAARSGAGAVVCACQEDIQSVLAVKMTEVMTLGLPASKSGGIETERAMEVLGHRLEQAKALLVGPGLGRHPDTQSFVRWLLQETSLPVVIDADGLNALEGHTELLKQHAGGNWIVTPHAGEFKRLAGSDVDLSDRTRVARHYAAEWNCVLILKGMPSVIACPDGRVFINGTGNPALATAGTGDVLSGMCAGLLAQGLPPDRAAVCALHVGGAAADRYAAQQDGRTMMALDLLDQLPHVLRERFAD